MNSILDYLSSKSIWSLLVLIVLLAGIPVGVNLIRQQQILRSRADVANYIKFAGSNVKLLNNRVAAVDKTIQINVVSPFNSSTTSTTTTTSTEEPEITAQCSGSQLRISWPEISGSTNYTLRVNREPYPDWSPAYTGTDCSTPTASGGSGDRACEAGNVRTKVINIGSYTGQFKGTITDTRGGSREFGPVRCGSTSGAVKNNFELVQTAYAAHSCPTGMTHDTVQLTCGAVGEWSPNYGSCQFGGTFTRNFCRRADGSDAGSEYVFNSPCVCRTSAGTTPDTCNNLKRNWIPSAGTRTSTFGGSCGDCIGGHRQDPANPSGACIEDTSSGTTVIIGTSPIPTSLPIATATPAGGIGVTAPITPTCTQTVATPLPPIRSTTQAPSGTTLTGYKISEVNSNEAWGLAPLQSYAAGETNLSDYTFVAKNCVTSPCDPFPREYRQIFVQFIGRTSAGEEYKEVWSNSILLALPPEITSAKCTPAATGSGVDVSISGNHLGNEVGAVTVGGVNTSIPSCSWNNLQVTANGNFSLSGDPKDVVVTTADGQASTPVVCSTGPSAVDFKATLACRSIERPLSVADVEIREDNPQAKSIFKQDKLTFDSDGRPQGLSVNLVEGGRYKLIIKVPNGLTKVINFTAAAGTTSLEAQSLPIGDIAPDRGDCAINNFDRSEMFRQWSAGKDTDKRGDLTLDGRINSIDYTCLMTSFNKSCERP